MASQCAAPGFFGKLRYCLDCICDISMNAEILDTLWNQSLLGLCTVPYYGYGRKKYGYIMGKFSHNLYRIFFWGFIKGTVQVKKWVYGHIYGYYLVKTYILNE